MDFDVQKLRGDIWKYFSNVFPVGHENDHHHKWKSVFEDPGSIITIILNVLAKKIFFICSKIKLFTIL
jgi:hypothetical protein